MDPVLNPLGSETICKEPVEIETLSDTIDLSNVKKEIQKNTKNEQKKQ